MGQQPHEVLLMNDEISLNVYGEPHFYEWHLDTGAWNALPDDAWAWTVYVPLDRAQPTDGGGWLRFREGGPPWTQPHATERCASRATFCSVDVEWHVSFAALSRLRCAAGPRWSRHLDAAVSLRRIDRAWVAPRAFAALLPRALR